MAITSGFSLLSHVDPTFLGAGISPDWVFMQCSGFIHPFPRQRVHCSRWKVLRASTRAHRMTVLFPGFMETLSLAAFLLANPSPYSWVTPHKAAALNICFSKIQPSSFTKAFRTLLAAELRYTETKTQAVTHLAAREERESPVSGTNPEDRPGSCLKPWTTDTEKGIRNNLHSYFHNLIFIPGSISNGFSLSLFGQLEMLPTACVKSKGAGFGHMEITYCSHQSHIKYSRWCRTSHLFSPGLYPGAQTLDFCCEQFMLSNPSATESF